MPRKKRRKGNFFHGMSWTKWRKLMEQERKKIKKSLKEKMSGKDK
jgi:hypothetical protein